MAGFEGLTGRPGGGVVEALIPIFQRNLQQQADVTRQTGPRFASGTERLVSEGSQRSLQDFNLFAQQALEGGLMRQLQTAIAGGQFSLGQQGLQLPILQQLLQAGILGSGVTQAPTLTQKPGTFSDILSGVGALGGLGIGLGGLGGLFGGLFGGGATRPGTPAGQLPGG